MIRISSDEQPAAKPTWAQPSSQHVPGRCPALGRQQQSAVCIGMRNQMAQPACDPRSSGHCEQEAGLLAGVRLAGWCHACLGVNNYQPNFSI